MAVRRKLMIRVEGLSAGYTLPLDGRQGICQHL